MELHFQWESNLLPLALKALEHERSLDCQACEKSPSLELAHQTSEQITRFHSKTFFMASSLLPPDKRIAARALYAFCRITDDIVDRGGENAYDDLVSWHEKSLSSELKFKPGTAEQEDLVALAWQQTSKQYAVPWKFAEQLICGVAQDLEKDRYASFSELAAYCYGVACTVGLMSMHIIGFAGPEAIPYAIRLGVALQLTNILRDVGEDWRLGRLYLPQDEMRAFGVTEADIEIGVVTSQWREFMKFQIERVNLLYASAMPGIGLLHPNGRFAIGAAAELYQRILKEIKKNDYDVFSRRAAVSKPAKLGRIPGIWWRSYRVNYPKLIISPAASNQS